jgi:hypothetical protein
MAKTSTNGNHKKGLASQPLQKEAHGQLIRIAARQPPSRGAGRLPIILGNIC